MLRILFTLLLIQKFRNTLVEAQVPLDEFYPHGPFAGDLALNSPLEATETISIQFNFPFFDSSFREVHISSNGIFSFGSDDDGWVPRSYPLVGRRSVASYWTDTDLEQGGSVFYRETNDPNVLSPLTDDVRLRFVEHQSFTSRWALIITFDGVPAFGCETHPTSCSTPCNETLTYQTILTSNGIQSFAILSFNSLKYTVGNWRMDACHAHAQVGFNAGDGKRFYLLPDSNTANIKNVALTSSNVGVPGKWMFTIGGSDIAEGCSERGQLNIYPRKLPYFGRQEVTISGICLQETLSVIRVTFGSAEVECNVTITEQLKCIAPLFSRLGSNSVTLIHNGITYRTFVVVVDVDALPDGNVEVIETNDLYSNFSLNWDGGADCGQQNYIVLKGFQFDYMVNTSGEILSEETEALFYDQVPNLGNAVLQPTQIERKQISSFIRRISLAGYCEGSDQITVTRTIYLVVPDLSNTHCLYWYCQQHSSTVMRAIIEEVSQRSPCAPSVASDIPRTMANFALDETCNPANPIMCAFFHTKARVCYRSMSNLNHKIIQCCVIG